MARVPFGQGKGIAPRDPKAPSVFQNVRSLVARRARAANFIVDIANGMSMKEIAAKYQVSYQLVVKEVAWAEREGFFEKAEDAILNRLVPKAIDVMEKALDKALETGDFEAADRVLSKLVKFFPKGPRGELAAAPQAAQTPEEEFDWERWATERMKRTALESGEAEGSAEEHGAPGAPTEYEGAPLSPEEG